MELKNQGLGSLLKEITEKNQETSQIIYLDIEEIEKNPQNFYGLRKIEELAGLISVSHLVEPLTVTKTIEGKYKLISGHRRRAAVQMLLEEGTYTDRKLPCIVKTWEKLEIEQENGETIEFDEDAVEMLNLIASNRGQREERTIDEKLQEVKYLEKFARAVYNKKNNRRRGRFVNFFAEEILNISKSQLLRMNALEKLTESVRHLVETNEISESAALEMASMAEAEQEECLEKIKTGEIKGTIQGIQNFKEPSKINVKEESEKAIFLEIEDVPEEFGDPQKEAEEWLYQASLSFYKKMYESAKRLCAKEKDKLKESQWGIRASVSMYKIEETKLQYKKSR